MASPLDKRVISINFVSGLDQKTDPKLTTRLTTADNVVIRKTGIIEKRPGFVANGTWTTSSISTNPVRVFPFGNGEFTISDWATDNATATSDTSFRGVQRIQGRIGNNWINAQPYEFATVNSLPFIANTDSIYKTDTVIIAASATQKGVMVGFAQNLNNVATTIIAMDLDTGYQSFSAANNSGTSRMVTFSATSLTAYCASISTNGDILFTSYDSRGIQTAVTTVSATVLTGVSVPDVVALGSKLYFTAPRSATQFTLGSIDVNTSATSLTVISSSVTNVYTMVLATPIPTTDRLRIFFNTASNTSIYYTTYSLTLSVIQSITSFLPLVGLTLGMSQLAACENTGGTSSSLWGSIAHGITANGTQLVSRSGWFGEYSNAGVSQISSGAASATALFPGSVLSSKPFLVHGQPHALISITSNQVNVSQQASTFLVRRVGSHHVPIARIHYGIGNGAIEGLAGSLPSPMSYDGDIFYSPVRRANYFRAASGSISVAYSVDSASFNFSQSQSLCTAELANSTYISGGFLQENDGSSIFEAGFLTPPSVIQSSTTSSGGALTAGQHALVVVKEYVNEQGKMFIGTPSLPYTLTVPGNGSITVVFTDWPSTRNSNTRRDGNRYAIYMTQAAGSIYYRVRSVTTSVDVPDSIGFSISSSDSSIAGGDVLYTQGGLLPRWTPDAPSVLCAHKGRLFCNDPTDNSIIRYSLSIASGEGVSFAQSNLILIPGVGRITAISPLDSQLIVFRRGHIFVVSGDGPDDTGTNGSFSDGQLLYADIGAVDQTHVIRFSQGLIFKSPDKGFYFLSRDLQLSYIGADIESYNSKTVVSSEVVGLQEASGTAEECRFLCSDGTLLTYNYYAQAWTTATLAGCTDAVQTGGRYVVVNPSSTAANARVFQQSLSTYTDAFSNTSVTYQMTVETGWVKTADIQGFQRIWNVAVLGEAQGPGDISVEVGYDYESAYNEAHTATMSSLTAANYTGGAVSAPQCNFIPARQKCQAIRFRIKDYPTTGAVMKLTNISLECGVKAGTFKLPPSKGI
jgi:hypothetical protein